MATLVPDGTVTAGGWKDQNGASTDLASPLADDVETTYIVSPINPVGAQVKVSLSNPPAGGVISGTVSITIDCIQGP